eukprot:1156235-Pelagomonas_calceolata.AAC.7
MVCIGASLDTEHKHSVVRFACVAPAAAPAPCAAAVAAAPPCLARVVRALAPQAGLLVLQTLHPYRPVRVLYKWLYRPAQVLYKWQSVSEGADGVHRHLRTQSTGNEKKRLRKPGPAACIKKA